MTLKVKVPGSCGEFVQGFFRGKPILITCPIEKFSTVTISDKIYGVEGLGKKSLSMLKKTRELLGIKLTSELPRGKGMASNSDLAAVDKIYGVKGLGEKSLSMLKKTQEFSGIKLTSELPRGKGMASSSADLAAVAKAVALSLHKNISAEEIAKLATSIEPTDGIFFSGVVAMNPVTGQFLKNISVPKNLTVAIFDYGGEVDTLKFNRRSNFQIPALDDTLNFELVEKSALANQKILHKKNLAEIVSFAKNLGAVTVNAAHSGTVIGIFFHTYDKNIDAKILEIARRFEFIKFWTKTNLISGGIFIENFSR